MKYHIVTSQELVVPKKAYSSASARATNQEASVVMHLMNNFQHAFVLFGCGMGKSGIYILQQLACCMYGVNCPKSIVISPHNTLLSMHHMQATKYFLGTSLCVEKLLPSNVAADEISSDFDLLFISIHAFKYLMDKSIPISFSNGTSKISSLTSITTYLANCSVTQTRGSLYVTWQDTTSKSLFYQHQLTHYSWTLLVIISG